MMKRRALLGLAIVLAVVIASGLLKTTTSSARSTRVYTVAQVRAIMARDPNEWVGRTVRVQGRVVITLLACPYNGRFWCHAIQWAEIDPDVPGPRPLLVVPESANPLLAALRRLPVVGRYVPASRALREGRGVFRIRLRATPHCPFLSANPSCANAVLLASS